jgi:hypothetical protein
MNGTHQIRRTLNLSGRYPVYPVYPCKFLPGLRVSVSVPNTAQARYFLPDISKSVGLILRSVTVKSGTVRTASWLLERA